MHDHIGHKAEIKSMLIDGENNSDDDDYGDDDFHDSD